MAELLVDEGIGQNLVRQLRAQGYRAVHALEVLSKGARDSLVFMEAQRLKLTIFTYNRDDYVLLARAWGDWGHGDHHGVISRALNQPQLPPAQTLRIMTQYCADTTSFVNRIELF